MNKWSTIFVPLSSVIFDCVYRQGPSRPTARWWMVVTLDRDGHTEWIRRVLAEDTDWIRNEDETRERYLAPRMIVIQWRATGNCGARVLHSCPWFLMAANAPHCISNLGSPRRSIRASRWQTLKKLTPRNSTRRNNLHIYATTLFCRYFITICIRYLYRSLQSNFRFPRDALFSNKFYSRYDLSL